MRAGRIRLRRIIKSAPAGNRLPPKPLRDSPLLHPRLREGPLEFHPTSAGPRMTPCVQTQAAISTITHELRDV